MASLLSTSSFILFWTSYGDSYPSTLTKNSDVRWNSKRYSIYHLFLIEFGISCSLFFPTRSFCSPISTFFSLSTSWIMWLYWKTLFKETAKKSSSSFSKKNRKSKINFTLRYFYTLFKNCDVLIALLGLGLSKILATYFRWKSKAHWLVLDFGGFFTFLFRRKIIICKIPVMHFHLQTMH